MAWNATNDMSLGAFAELRSHHKRMLLAVSEVLDSTMASDAGNLNSRADSLEKGVLKITGSLRAIDSKLVDLPLAAMMKGINVMSKAQGVLGKLTEPLGIFKTILDAIKKVSDKLE
jgi:hypothetical protein